MVPESLLSSNTWSLVPIGELADVIVGGTPSTSQPLYWGGNVPWMASGDVHRKRVREVTGRITDLGLQSSNAKMVEPPAVAIALAGQGKTRGTAAITYIPLCTNQSVALIKPRDSRLLAEYLYHVLDYRYEELRGRSSGAGRAGLTKALIENIPLALPSRPEQEAIAAILDLMDRTISQFGALLSKFHATKRGLMHDLLTGKVTVEGLARQMTGGTNDSIE
jgi:type I restriction enzyme, S subunit